MDGLSRFPSLATVDVASLVSRMNRDGYGVVPGFPGDEELARARAFVADATRRSGGEYVGFTGSKSLAGSGLDELARWQPFRDLAEQVYAHGTGLPPPRDGFYQVLRCLAGKTGGQHSHYFHYDSYVLTILLPIQIPTEGMTGDLLMFPNRRPIRRTYLGNILDKVLLDNTLTQRALRTLVNTKRLPATRVKMTAGNLYFFWGYRSVHANEPCDPRHVRATALFHYVNPHAGAGRGLMRWFRPAHRAAT